MGGSGRWGRGWAFGRMCLRGEGLFQLLLKGRKGEEGSEEEGWRKVEHDPVCQIQRVSCGQGQRQWDVSPGTGTLGI